MRRERGGGIGKTNLKNLEQKLGTNQIRKREIYLIAPNLLLCKGRRLELDPYKSFNHLVRV